jgi:hypothetical protein
MGVRKPPIRRQVPELPKDVLAQFSLSPTHYRSQSLLSKIAALARGPRFSEVSGNEILWSGRHYKRSRRSLIPSAFANFRIDPEFLAALRTYHWPGNVRGLRNVFESAVLMTRLTRLSLEDLPKEIKVSTNRETSFEVFLGSSLQEIEQE